MPGVLARLSVYWLQGTVEDRIFDVQVAKRQLAADMLSKGGAKRPVVGAGLNRNDFRKIFELNEYDKQRRERIRSEKEKQRQERRRAAGLMSPDAAAVSPSVAANPDVVVALRVRPGTGAAFSPLTVEARSTHTVHQLKDQLSGRISIPAAQQQLATVCFLPVYSCMRALRGCSPLDLKSSNLPGNP